MVFKMSLHNVVIRQDAIQEATDEIIPEMLNNVLENTKRRITWCIRENLHNFEQHV